jgi:UDP-N-acetylmuramate dehydrogenase
MSGLRFQQNAELLSFNTLRLPAIASSLLTITDVAQLSELRRCPEFVGRRCLILGGGSNLVFTGNVDGVILRVAITGRQLLADDAGAWYVRAGAGESWREFVAWTLREGWPGLENLSLIPGTVGAAPIQNIGAYGLEMSERFHSLDAYDLTRGRAVSFDQKDCHFDYRDSLFKQKGWHLAGRFVITGVTFRLPKPWQPVTHYVELANELAEQGLTTPSPQQIADAVMAIRKRKLPDPEQIPNAGSFFQNPIVDVKTAERLVSIYPHLPRYPQSNGLVKIAAAWLIEQAGWKGRDLGRAGMFERQALVLVNRGGACGQDILDLAHAVQADVRQRFGVELRPEPVFV